MIAGPDGVGKTAVARGLVSRLRVDGEALHLHARPNFLPGRGRGEVAIPHKNHPYGRPGSIAKLLYLYADFALGWFLRLRPFIRRGGTIIMERGWWDLLVDPYRYRITPSPRVVRLMGRLLPAVDAVIVLEAPATILGARKGELSVEELTRQANLWRSLSGWRSDILYVDASRPIETVVDEVWACLQRVDVDR